MCCQILDPLKIKYQIPDPPPPNKNQISDIRPPPPPQQKSNIRYQTPTKVKYQIIHPLQNQISDITPPAKSNIRYLGTPVPPPPINIVIYIIVRVLLILCVILTARNLTDISNGGGG